MFLFRKTKATKDTKSKAATPKAVSLVSVDHDDDNFGAHITAQGCFPLLPTPMAEFVDDESGSGETLEDLIPCYTGNNIFTVVVVLSLIGF